VNALRAPFPWFGGKSRAAHLVWDALGDVASYIEPFAGSAAVLLARPHAPRCETINDRDGMVANFWRAVKAAPAEVAHHADWPVNEADLHARHRWLIGQRESLTERLIADPEWFDARVAGWWCWGACAWIGDGWCVKESRRLPFFGNTGMGVHSARGADWQQLSRRLATVDVACGDWSRVSSPTVVLRAAGTAGVYFDPPYAEGAQQYAAGGTGSALSAEVRAWCEEHGSNPRMRIVLSGYEGEHDALQRRGWRVVEWRATGAGYVAAGGERTNQRRERLWFSPHCVGARQLGLFDTGGAR
jgi:site-specific DNA-adenine methylase